MSARRVARLVVLLVSLLVAQLSGSVLPAHAEDVVPSVTTLGATPPVLGVDFTHTATTQTACAWGSLREPPATNRQWRVALNGLRSSTTYAAITETRAYSNVNAFSDCITIQKLGAVSGGFTVTVSYTGVGNDYPSSVVGTSTWAQGEDLQVGTSQ